jgi:hypothetical protein
VLTTHPGNSGGDIRDQVPAGGREAGQDRQPLRMTRTRLRSPSGRKGRPVRGRAYQAHIPAFAGAQPVNTPRTSSFAA